MYIYIYDTIVCRYFLLDLLSLYLIIKVCLYLAKFIKALKYVRKQEKQILEFF